jgi:hypothetical protein
MAALSPAIRSGPLAVLIALAMASPAGARDANAPHHLSISGSLTPLNAPAQGGSMQMQSGLSKPTAALVEQAGAGFVLSAKLAERPLGCGSDTIFENGFDP